MKRLLAFACAIILIGAPLGSTAADPYEINVIIPQTGGAAFRSGKEEFVALGVVEGVVNKSGGIRGRPIKFTFFDDQSSPQVAVQLLNQVVANGCPDRARFDAGGDLQRDGTAGKEQWSGDVLLFAGNLSGA